MATTSRLLLLRRGDHDSRLTEGFESLLDKESMTDVSITCGQQIVRAHRTVLSIFSPFFKRIFDSIQNPIHYPFVVLKDMPFADLKAIIDLMYRGEVTVTQDRFPSLKQSAEVLEVSELSDIISSYEEKNDIKPKVEENSYQGRHTRKRGRPKKYTEDESDDEFKVLPTTGPPTKRQQVLLSKSTTTIVKRPIVQTITPPPKAQPITRGTTNISYIRQPTASRGGYSAFQRPPTATRGAVAINAAKPQTATRGATRGSAVRGRGFRFVTKEEDEDYDPSLDSIPRRTTTRQRGRPSRSTRSSTDLPMATSLPLSVPEPIRVDLANIFPNYNSNTVTSSTPNVVNISIPIIKREADSDSEVECIMSSNSPLPSGVVEDIDLNQILQTSSDEITTNVSISTESNQLTTSNDNNNEVSVDPRASDPEPVPMPIESTSEVSESEMILIQPNVVKTERPETPVTECPQIRETQELDVSGDRSGDQNTEIIDTSIRPNPQDLTSTSDSAAVTAPTINLLENTESRESDIPLIRFIKSERISPPIVQSVSESSNQSHSNEPEVTTESAIPVLSRVKIERLSPNTETNNNIIDISEENSQTADRSSDVTSTRGNESSVEINVCSNQLPEESNEVEITYSLPTHTLQQIKVERRTSQDVDQQSSCESVTQNIECTSSSGQQSNTEPNEQSNQQFFVENTTDDNVIDVQQLAFDCFYTTDDQPMQTSIAETTTSSITSSDVNPLFPSNTNHEIISTSETTQPLIGSNLELNERIFSFNTTQQQMSDNSVNTFPMDNNVVMNSPIHSDEECMLLDSPQHSGYEVTINSEPNLDDSMDDRL